jgi:hypothetical protein
MTNYKTRIGCLLLAVLAVLAAKAIVAAPGQAAGPELKLHVTEPDSMPAGEFTTAPIAIQNVGDASTTASITLTVTLGPGLEPLGNESLFTVESSARGSTPLSGSAECQASGQTLTCSLPGPLPPGAQLKTGFYITVAANASGMLTDTVSISGGGATGGDTYEHIITIGPAQPFGFDHAEARLQNADESAATQAASDPAYFSTYLTFKTSAEKFFFSFAGTTPVEWPREIGAHLPPGLIGDPGVIPALCTVDQLSTPPPTMHFVAGCPLDSQVGIARIDLGGASWIAGLFNMVPPPGSATELGFAIYGTVVLLDAHVRPGDHGIDIFSRNTETSYPVDGVEITVWGVPSDRSHDPYRGGCLESQYDGPNGFLCPTEAPRRAFLRLPTSCSGNPLAFGASANSYEHGDVWAQTSFSGPVVENCDAVPFAPRISVQPTGVAANSPTGVSVKVSLPQNANPDGLAEADLRKAVVTLPEGMAINPSAADGLRACTDEELNLASDVPAACPDGSKIGTVVLHTPLIPSPIEGSIYVRTQNSSDPQSGEMFRIAIELRDDVHGLDFKISGQISVDPATGQLTTTFDDNPQFPFDDISLHFKAGARAPLVTPASCEAQSTEANLYSWAQPDAPVHRTSSFQLTSGPEGTPCVATQPFNPGFSAGVSSVQAGGFTPFLATFSRKDVDQSMRRVSVKMPPGLLGSLAGLPLCGEAQANAGSCPQVSEIGSVTAGAGAGPTPFYVTGGHVYMTGPYGGAPFGLSVVVPAKAGPFDLGTVVVRARVDVDPHTAQLTVTTDPLPQIVGGVPVNLRLVNVTVNRPSFVFNPTNCDPMEVTGSMSGGQGAAAALANHFQVTNCGALGFKPSFRVSTSGKTSRANGASLDARLTYPKAGGQANIAKVKVSLPKQLPSRLSTLQKACPAQTFEANPAACPVASRIGTATAVTPVLPVPLTGPAYFVSHGGEAFPDLVVVLQGDGVAVDLVGTTFISKAGITSTTFKQVPDVPVGSFDLKLPQGPDSALAANGNLCASSLRMPTAFIAQDGAVIHRATPITTTGCARHRAKHHHRKHRRK